MSVAVLPMSIWPQAMLNGPPSSEMALVRPVIACLLAVYEAACGRGTWAEIEPLLMIRPPCGDCAAHGAERLARDVKGAVEVGVDHPPPDVHLQIADQRWRCKGSRHC